MVIRRSLSQTNIKWCGFLENAICSIIKRSLSPKVREHVEKVCVGQMDTSVMYLCEAIKFLDIIVDPRRLYATIMGIKLENHDYLKFYQELKRVDMTARLLKINPNAQKFHIDIIENNMSKLPTDLTIKLEEQTLTFEFF